MPDLHSQVGRLIAPIPLPKVDGLQDGLLHPSTIHESEALVLSAPTFYSTPVVGPQVRIFQALSIERGEPTALSSPVIYSSPVRRLAFHSTISQNPLAPLQQSAQFDWSARISRWDVVLSSSALDSHVLVLQPVEFPLVARQFEVDISPTPVVVSEDRFRSLGPARMFGMDYRDRYWRELPSSELAARTLPKKERSKPLCKSYVDTEQVGGRQAKPKRPSFWDMLFVILQPRLGLQRLDSPWLPHPLLNFQPAGIDFLMKNESALLADEMGTGKTVMTAVALKILMQQGKAHRALIACPLSVLREWNRHLAEWTPELRVTFVRGSQSTRQVDWLMPAHVYVTTYDTLRADVENGILPKDKRDEFDIVVLDEAQNIKNPKSGRSRAIEKLVARQRWALTGTPIENKIDDVASIFSYLRPGYLTPFDLYPQRIKEKIAPYFLRRRKKEVLPDLPPMQNEEVWLELDEDQRAAYNGAAEEVKNELTALGSRVTKAHIFASVQRLKQICNFAPGQLKSPKLDRLKEQIEEITENGQKAIVFSQYIGEGIEKLEEALSSYGIAKLVGGQSEPARNAEVDRFKRLDAVPILLASVKAGGVGLNLTEASYVVHFDHWWNPAVRWQAEARVHRKGQKRGVNVYSYWISDTIEERIYTVLDQKRLLFEDVIDSMSDSQIEEAISTEEWLDMLGVKQRQEESPQPKRETVVHLSLEEIRDKLYTIKPAEFEDLIRELMHYLGYPNVKVTGRTGDGGLDVISTRNTGQGVARAVAQCKRYRGTVGVEIARALRGAMDKDKSIEKGFLVTSGEFSRECISYCVNIEGIVPLSGLQVAQYVKQFGLTI